MSNTPPADKPKLRMWRGDEMPVLTERERQIGEESYRRGYWHGYSQAMDDVPARLHRSAWWGRMAHFFDRPLMTWRYARHEGRMVLPPSFSAYTANPDAPPPVITKGMH